MSDHRTIDAALDPFENSLFLFCGRKTSSIKGILWEEDGFLLLAKRLDEGKFQWPKKQ
ncbi:IS66 family insertion sequence element accessory protein TnpB [Dubosiella newyorkensis]|uniref:IS66 family insertion sequence element accessory protein TnpB n=1 Tax=Dubosiella newyorkensis TaxID=1862672 RepID=UPI003F670E31